MTDDVRELADIDQEPFANALLRVENSTEQVPDVPPSIVVAICRVKSSMEVVAKAHQNAHGNYKFTSIDDIDASLVHRMGEAGLTILVLEEETPEIKRVEIDQFDREGANTGKKVQQWGKFVFSFVLATKEATWFDRRNKRTLMVQIMGPQTYQAAASYAEKAYYKSLFKIPTGDMELDSLAEGETEQDQVALASNGRTPRKSSSKAKKDGTTELFNEIKQKLELALDPAMCQQIRTLYAEEWATMPTRWVEMLNHTFEDCMQHLGAGLEQEA